MEGTLEKVFPTKSSKDIHTLLITFIDKGMFMYARIRLPSLQYLFLYSLVQTVSMIQARHLKEPVLTQLSKYSRIWMLMR